MSSQSHGASHEPRHAVPLEAYVLHHYDWSESSLILDLFTREQGRLAVAAKGAKRPYSQLRAGAAAVPAHPRDARPRGRCRRDAPEVQTLRGAEWAGGQPMLAGAALFSGFYLNELLMKLLARHDPHPAAVRRLRATLPALGGERRGAGCRRRCAPSS